MGSWAIRQQGVFTTTDEIERLGFIDFSRLNGHWPTIGQALRTVGAALIDRAAYTLYDIDMSAAPNRDDWPGWRHVGRHPLTGRTYWNWFYYTFPGSRLALADEPDLNGTLVFPEAAPPDDAARFLGDIGRVAASTFMLSWNRLEQTDLWITVWSDAHLLVQPTVSPAAMVRSRLLADPDDRAELGEGPFSTAGAALAALQADLQVAGIGVQPRPPHEDGRRARDRQVQRDDDD